MSSPDELLSFKEFTPTNNSESATINVNSPQKNQYTFLSSVGVGGLLEENADFLTAGDLSDGPVKSDKLNGEGDQTDKMVYSLFTIEYYQQFFNVDTVMVVDRIFTSMIPKRAPGNYLKAHIGLNPDLYGPFWIVITLVSWTIFNYTYFVNKSYLFILNLRFFQLQSVETLQVICKLVLTKYINGNIIFI